LLAKFEDEKGQKFLAESPEKLAGVLKQKQTEFKQILPNLLAIANTGNDLKPEVKFYQGQEGLKAVYEDTLSSGQKGDEILAYFSAQDILSILPDYIMDYLQRRIKKGIKMLAIVRDSEMAQKHQRQDAKELRQTILLPKDKFNLTIEKNIYADKIALMSFRGWPMGIIIKSKQIANSERIIFELLWKNLSNF